MIQQSLIIGINSEYIIVIAQEFNKNNINIKTGEHLNQVIDKDTLLILKENILKLKEGKSNIITISTKNSEFNEIKITKNPIEKNKIWVLLHFYKKTGNNYYNDYSKKEEKEEIITNNTHKKEEYINHTPINHLSININTGNIINLNPFFVRKLGYEHREEIIGKHISNFILKKSKRIKLYKSLQKNKYIYNQDVTLTTKNKKKLYLRANIYLTKNANRNVKTYEVVLIDITDLKNRQSKLQEKNTLLQKNNSKLKKIISICSHDLQEPLATIKFSADIIQKQYKHLISEQSLKHLSYINQAVDRLSSQIKYLLLKSTSKDKENCDINEIIQTVLKDLQNNIVKSQAAIKVQKAIPLIKGYPIDLRLLFQNIIANAVHHRSSNTTPQIDLSFIEHKDCIEFHVKDNAKGILQIHHKKIFRYVTKINSDTNNGIGLYHCKQIVAKHNGKIWVESQKECGSIFKFTISKKK